MEAGAVPTVLPGYNGRVAVVTAGNSGIGLATVQGLVASGAKVIANDLNSSQLSAIEGVVVVEGDLSSAKVRDELIQTARAEGNGRIDALFNNAGIAAYKSLVDMTDDDWRRTMALNLDAAIDLATVVARMMAKTGGGAILHTASTAGTAALPHNVAYVVAKHALVGLTRSMAVDLGPLGIRTNALCPGLTATAMTRGVRETSPGYWSRREAIIPLRRAAQPTEQAAVALFLNSDLASYVNGLVAVVDGGAHALYASSAVQRPELPD
jgi:NAD(P)-dependent dehydrogenase (short-subunit alcohol dehydrogenase family)